MGDVGDYWNDIKESKKEESKERRMRNRKSSICLLEDLGVDFIEKNDGAHLIVQGKECVIDFWPGTGKFITRKGQKGRGVFNLIKFC